MKLEICGSKETGFYAHGTDNGDHVLELCPFCKSNDIKISNTHAPNYWGECRTCGATGPNGWSPKHRAKTEKGTRQQHVKAFNDALSLWNNRA